MTQAEFLQRLSQLKTDWKISYGRIRHKQTEACPIEELAGVKGAYGRAGPLLKLSEDLVQAIAWAADKHPGYDRELRALLLRAVQLPEEDPDEEDR